MGEKVPFFFKLFYRQNIFLPAQAVKMFLPVNRFTGTRIYNLRKEQGREREEGGQECYIKECGVEMGGEAALVIVL